GIRKTHNHRWNHNTAGESLSSLSRLCRRGHDGWAICYRYVRIWKYSELQRIAGGSQPALRKRFAIGCHVYLVEIAGKCRQFLWRHVMWPSPEHPSGQLRAPVPRPFSQPRVQLHLRHPEPRPVEFISGQLTGTPDIFRMAAFWGIQFHRGGTFDTWLQSDRSRRPGKKSADHGQRRLRTTRRLNM